MVSAPPLPGPETRDMAFDFDERYYKTLGEMAEFLDSDLLGVQYMHCDEVTNLVLSLLRSVITNLYRETGGIIGCM